MFYHSRMSPDNIWLKHFRAKHYRICIDIFAEYSLQYDRFTKENNTVFLAYINKYKVNIRLKYLLVCEINLPSIRPVDTTTLFYIVIYYSDNESISTKQSLKPLTLIVPIHYKYINMYYVKAKPLFMFLM